MSEYSVIIQCGYAVYKHSPVKSWERWCGPWSTLEKANELRDRAAKKYPRVGLHVVSWKLINNPTPGRFWDAHILIAPIES